MTRRVTGKQAHNLRLRLFEAQDGICPPCQKPLDLKQVPNSPFYPTLDHVVPASEDGSNRLDNLLLTHRVCNARRGNRPPTAFEQGWLRRNMRQLGLDEPQTGEAITYRFFDLRSGQFVP
jgi:5-methylcytosine-specific restriction endonuclease McrA